MRLRLRPALALGPLRWGGKERRGVECWRVGVFEGSSGQPTSISTHRASACVSARGAVSYSSLKSSAREAVL